MPKRGVDQLKSTARSTNKTPLEKATGRKTTPKNAPPAVNTGVKRSERGRRGGR